MLLFFLTYRFPGQFLSYQAITFWDVRNEVPTELAAAFQLFEPIIQQFGNEKKLLEAYNKLTSTLVGNSRRLELKKWVDVVASGTLSQYDIDFFEPSLLLHTLINFKPRSAQSAKAVYAFLDKFTQFIKPGISDFAISLRINIAFSKFLAEDLDQCLQDKALLLMQLKIYRTTEDPQNLQDSVIANIFLHIAKQIARKSINTQGNSRNLLLFGNANKIKGSTLMITGNNLTVSSIVESCLKMVNKECDNLASEVYRRLLSYLQGLQRPVLTCQEVQASIDCVRSIADPLNAFT